MRLEIPAELSRLLHSVPPLRRAYLVGGCVRDALLGLPGKDFDVEVYGVGYEELAEALRPFGRVDLVGRSFGVIKLALGGAIHDFSVPRHDSKTGPGHRGFEIRFDPDITPREAAARRDFTINSLMWDPHAGTLLDFFGGREDLERRILRHTGPAFSEDPLRVLRGMHFAGRFDLEATPETIDLCRQIVSAYHELAPERVREEWFKWAARSSKPSAGLHFLDSSGWIAHFPEIAELRETPQDPGWHPEGNVFLHTCHSLDALVRLPEWRSESEATRIVWTLAVLGHDFGKVVCTRVVERDGRSRIISPGHELESVRRAETFLARIQAPRATVDRVAPLVANHMAHFSEVSDRAVRRLARRLAPETVENLCVVMTADAQGRPPREPLVPPAVDALRASAQRLAVANNAPRPFLRGRHLLDLGLESGPAVGKWVSAAFEAQLDGRIENLSMAFAWLAEQEALPARIRDTARHRASTPNEG